MSCLSSYNWVIRVFYTFLMKVLYLQIFILLAIFISLVNNLSYLWLIFSFSSWCLWNNNFLFRQDLLYQFFLFIFPLFSESEEGREKERERNNQCVVASHAPSTGDLARNPGMCPDWESNHRPFGLQAGTESTEPHQPGQFFLLGTIFLESHLQSLCLI